MGGYWTNKERSEDTKRKISRTLKGHKNPNGSEIKKGKTYEEIYGIKKAKEIEDKISKGNKGKKVTMSFREEMRKISLERIREGTHNFYKQKPWNYIDGRSKTLSPMRYGDDWERLRYLVYLRDHFTCQTCGIKNIKLDIHHKVPYLYSGDNSLDNLISLCRSCHMREEHNLKREYKEIKINIKGRGF